MLPELLFFYKFYTEATNRIRMLNSLATCIDVARGFSIHQQSVELDWFQCLSTRTPVRFKAMTTLVLTYHKDTHNILIDHKITKAKW